MTRTSPAPPHPRAARHPSLKPTPKTLALGPRSSASAAAAEALLRAYDHLSPPRAAGRDWAAPEVRYVRDEAGVDRAVRRLMEGGDGPLGFDVEWCPTFRKGQAPNKIALLQLADRHFIALIQLSALPRFPPSLSTLLSSARPKAGVSVALDAAKLAADYGPTAAVQGAAELSFLARRWEGGEEGKELIGLRKLVEKYLGRRLVKGRAQMSNWELPLGRAQIEYAARDAFCALQLYEHFTSSLTPAPAPSAPSTSALSSSFTMTSTNTTISTSTTATTTTASAPSIPPPSTTTTLSSAFSATTSTASTSSTPKKSSVSTSFTSTAPKKSFKPILKQERRVLPSMPAGLAQAKAKVNAKWQGTTKQ